MTLAKALAILGVAFVIGVALWVVVVNLACRFVAWLMEGKA